MICSPETRLIQLATYQQKGRLQCLPQKSYGKGARIWDWQRQQLDKSGHRLGDRFPLG